MKSYMFPFIAGLNSVLLGLSLSVSRVTTLLLVKTFESMLRHGGEKQRRFRRKRGWGGLSVITEEAKTPGWKRKSWR